MFQQLLILFSIFFSLAFISTEDMKFDSLCPDFSLRPKRLKIVKTSSEILPLQGGKTKARTREGKVMKDKLKYLRRHRKLSHNT